MKHRLQQIRHPEPNINNTSSEIACWIVTASVCTSKRLETTTVCLSMRLVKLGYTHTYAPIKKNKVVLYTGMERAPPPKKMQKANCRTMCKVCYHLCKSKYLYSHTLAYTWHTSRRKQTGNGQCTSLYIFLNFVPYTYTTYTQK